MVAALIMSMGQYDQETLLAILSVIYCLSYVVLFYFGFQLYVSVVSW